jgi:hypothetical protein
MAHLILLTVCSALLVWTQATHLQRSSAHPKAHAVSFSQAFSTGAELAAPVSPHDAADSHRRTAAPVPGFFALGDDTLAWDDEVLTRGVWGEYKKLRSVHCVR